MPRRFADSRNAFLSEHRVRIGRRFGNALQNVPGFDDLAVIIETEDIDAGPVAVSWPLLIAVQDDELTIGQHPPKTRRASPVLGEAR